MDRVRDRQRCQLTAIWHRRPGSLADPVPQCTRASAVALRERWQQEMTHQHSSSRCQFFLLSPLSNEELQGLCTTSTNERVCEPFATIGRPRFDPWASQAQDTTALDFATVVSCSGVVGSRFVEMGEYIVVPLVTWDGLLRGFLLSWSTPSVLALITGSICGLDRARFLTPVQNQDTVTFAG